MANFTEDHRTENWLKLRGVKYEYREQMRYDELAPNWNIINQGRPDAVPQDASLIDKYASAMDQGAIFPSPIIAKIVGGYEVLDGCQRLCAAQKCGQSIFNAYIIRSDNPSIRASVRVCANSVLNGTSPSQEWTIAKVVDVLFEQYNLGIVDCSQWSGQPVEKIEIEIASRDGARWLRVWDVDTKIKPANQKGFLAAFSRLAPMNDRAKLTEELPDLVRKLQDCKANNDEAIKLLEECLSVSRVRGTDLRVAVRKQIDEVMGRPEIQSRLSSKRTMHPVDNALRGMAAAITTLRATSRGNHHADKKQSEQLLLMLEEARKLSQKIVPKDFWPALAESMSFETARA